MDRILKWIATVILVVGAFVNAGLPHLYPLGPALLILGGIFWFIVSVMWREAALMVTNGVMLIVALAGLIYQTLMIG